MKKIKPMPEPVSNEVEIATFKAHLKIVKDNLDDEVSRQPFTFSDVADRFAHAKSVRDALKDRLKTIESEVYLSMRARADREDKRVSETQLGHMVQCSGLRKKAFRRLNEAERQLLEWEGLKEAWKDRSFMLREVCSLQLSTVLGDSSVSSADFVRRDAKAAQAREARRNRRENRR